MTSVEWHEHAAKCREVARTIDDVDARRVLLEAADDYLALAAREAAVAHLAVPAYCAMR